MAALAFLQHLILQAGLSRLHAGLARVPGEELFVAARLRNRHGLPIDLAKAILFLVSDDSDFIAGTALWVDGGVSTIMPGNE
jgi:NAD(P)-dependent dehydrogenase (short-subunit alcohol dehydrogenase family)